jgi:hypothetical protein
MPRFCRRAGFAALAILVVLGAGCSLFRAKTVLTVDNKSSITQTISNIYVYASGSSPSLDVLSGSTIPYNSTKTILSQSFLAGTYTIQVVFSTATTWTYTGIVFDGNPYTLTVTTQP